MFCLFRALTSKGEVRTLTCNPLGIHSIRELTRLVNERLPVQLQLMHPTGHTGRVTLSSIAMNNNVGCSVEVAAATKHRDPKSLLGYIRKDYSSLGAAALGVSNAIKKRGRDFSIAGVEFDTDIDEGNDNSSSTSAPIPNSNVNTNLSKKVNYSDGKNSINLIFDMREYHYANNNHSSQL